MQDVIADAPRPASVVSRDDAPEKTWAAPLGSGRLFALLLSTCGCYSFFYLYRTARDLRDHADPSVTPWLYPPSILIGLANAFAGARLARAAQDFAGYDQRRASASPGVVGVLIFIAHVLLAVLGNLTMVSLWVLALIFFTLPWLLLERQLDVIKLALPNPRYRSKPHRFTKLQWVAVALGGALWVLLAWALWDDVIRWRGTALTAGVSYDDPQGRFSFTPSRGGWLLVAQGSVAEDAELELFGPDLADWAVVHVTELAGGNLDSLVEDRYAAISTVDEDMRFSEKRELLPGSNIVRSHATYRGTDVFDGPFVFHVAAFVTEQRSVELIVYSAGRQRETSGALELARSLEPGRAQESAVDE